MHQKILIVGTVPYNRQMSSRAFESYFSNWEKENLAQIFSNPNEPVQGHCGTFFQITDKRMLMRRLKKMDTGVIYNDSELTNESKNIIGKNNKGFISKLYGLGSRKFPLNHLLRSWLWKKDYWCTQKLNKWLDDFSPECVFLAFSDDFFIPQIALYVAEKYDVPIISCIGDDYYFNDRKSISPFYYIYKYRYKKLIQKVFNHGGSAAYIGNKIRDKYNLEFSINGETVYLTSELKRHEFRKINLENPYISYCGNIRLGRAESLCMIATSFSKINPNYKIHIFSNESEEKYYNVLKKHPNIIYEGSVPYSSVMDIMNKSDILLIVEGFKKKDVDITRYSLSTKVADSLAIGGSILTLGSIDCGAIEYMKNIDCGPVCTSTDQLDINIKKLLYDEEYQRKNYEKSYEISNKNHNLQNSNRIFEEIVENAIKIYYTRGENSGVKR